MEELPFKLGIWVVRRFWMCADIRERHSAWREQQEQSSGNDGIEVILSGVAGVHGVGRLDRPLGTSRMSILGYRIWTYSGIGEELGKVFKVEVRHNQSGALGYESSYIVYSRQKRGRTRNDRGHVQRQLLNEQQRKKGFHWREIVEVQSTESSN